MCGAVRTGCLRRAKTPNLQAISQGQIQGNLQGEKALLFRVKLLIFNDMDPCKKIRAKLRRDPRRASTRPG
jgi:hypothetical protein